MPGKRREPSYYPTLRTDGTIWLKHISRAVAKHAERGETLLSAGQIVEGIIYLYRGLLKYSLLAEDGGAKTVGIIEPTTVVGEGPFFNELPCLIQVEAMQPSDYYYFPRALVDELLQTDPEVARSVMVNLSGKVRMLLRQISDLRFHELPTRLASTLFLLGRRYGRIRPDGVALTLRLSHEELAEMVGGTRSTVTTIMGQMRSEGLIDFSTRRVEILDMRRLCEAARPARLAGEESPCGECPGRDCPGEDEAAGL